MIAYRRPDLLAEVLKRLTHQTHQPNHVIVVDNGGDLPETGLPDHQLDVHLVRRPDNPGYAAAVNVAREHDAARTLVLTHDAVFGDDLAEKLSAALDENPAAGAAAPVLHWADRPGTVFSAGGVLTRGGRAWHRTDSPQQYREVDWVDGAIVMYANDALDQIDWLDERYFLYFEDVDTAYRMSRVGRTTLIVPYEQALQQPGNHTTYLGIRNMTLFARTAAIPFPLHLAAVGRRVLEEAVVALMRRRSPGVVAAYRGWRAGRRGLTGHPPSTH